VCICCSSALPVSYNPIVCCGTPNRLLRLAALISPWQIERFAFPIMGRIVLEGHCPMLELSMIVSLTYDHRRSWTARFCNTRPIKLLGDISMSFYMTHMLAYMFFTGVSYS
jgi:peptidoglycan/LPS O-acetylase OafA/YrhL